MAHFSMQGDATCRQRETGSVWTHLDLVFRSSEDSNFPSHNLQTTCETSGYGDRIRARDVDDEDDFLPALHGGWESERFCEYPQELVFRVNRGIPTRIDQLHLLSHHSKIASRIEIFTSSISQKSQEWDEHAQQFQRLGFVAFQSNEASNFTSRELKMVRLPVYEKIAMIRLVLHACHANRHNLFQQVGLLSVMASQVPQHNTLHSSASWSPVKESSPIERSFLPSLRPGAEGRASSDERDFSKGDQDHIFSSSLSPLRMNYENKLPLGKRNRAKKLGSTPSLLSRHQAKDAASSGGNHCEVWIPELKEYRSPLQIATHVEFCQELARCSGKSSISQSWKSMELECRHLTTKMEILLRAYDGTRHLIPVDERIALQDEMDAVLQKFSALGSTLVEQERLLKTRITLHENAHQRRHPEASLVRHRPDLKEFVRSDTWQAREDAVWKIIEFLKCTTDDAQQSAMEDALQVVKQALNDVHSQVFVAACSLLHLLLTGSHRFQEPSSWKGDIAESSRGKGTFVMHFILKKLEDKQLQLTDQILHAILKLFSALLVSFHCCASIDIAPRRVLRFMLRSDADLHANPHIREAAKQLTLALYNEVGSDAIQSYLVKLPAETQEMYQQHFKSCDEKKAQVLESESE